VNLRETYGIVGSLLGDPAQIKIERGELLSFINVAQNFIAGVLINIEREWFATTYTVAAVGGTADYQMPADFRDPIRVTYNSVECNRKAISELSALDRNPGHKPIKGHTQWYSMIGGTNGRTKLTIYPTPDGTENIKVWYFRKPTDFHELGTYDGTTTSDGSTTPFITLIDTKIPFTGTTDGTMNSFWVGAQIRFTSLLNNNQRSRVTTHAISTDTLTFDAVSDRVLTGTTYELDQVSVIPDQYHHLIAYYAAFMAAMKLGQPAPWMQQVQLELDMLKAKWLSNVEAGGTGHMPGTASDRVEHARTA